MFPHPSVNTEVELLVVVAQTMAEKEINSRNKLMIINNNTKVVEVSSKIGGVTEVVEIIKGSKMMDVVVSTVVSMGM